MLAFHVGLYTLSIVGVLLVMFGLIYNSKASKRTILSAEITKKIERKTILDKILDKLIFIRKSEEKIDIMLSVLDIQNKTPRSITKMRIFWGLLGILVGILLRNIMAMPLIAAVAFNIPMYLMNRNMQKRRMVYNDQILEALQIFVTDYTTTKSVQKTLENTCAKIKRPLRTEFERLARRLHSGIPVNECFLDFAKRTQNQWITFFAQVMMMYYRNGGDFVPHLTGIVRTMSSEKLIEEQNNTELAGLKTMNMVLVALFPVAFIVSVLFSPDTVRVFTETGAGRMIIFFSIAGCLFSLFLGQKIAEY